MLSAEKLSDSYDNGSQIIQITDNEYLDNKADINDFGYIVWEGGSGTLSEVYLYDGLTTIQFTNHGQFSSDTHINNLGDVTWAEPPPNHPHLFLAAD